MRLVGHTRRRRVARVEFGRRMTSVSAFVAARLTIITSVAHAQNLGEELAKAFIGSCLQMLPRTDRIEAAARALAFKPIEGDTAGMLAPQARDAAWKAWLVDQAPAPPFFLFISEGDFEGEKMKICGVSNPYAPEDQVVPHLLRILSLAGPIYTDIEAGQRTRIWRTELNDEEAIVSVVDATPMEETGLHLSGMMKAGGE